LVLLKFNNLVKLILQDPSTIYHHIEILLEKIKIYKTLGTIPKPMQPEKNIPY